MRKWKAGACVYAALLASLSGAAFGQERHEIEVRGTKIPFRENPSKDMIVIEGEILRRLPAFQLAELIGLAANASFVFRGLFQADPQMQGLNQEQIAVLIDGIPVNNVQTGHHNFLLPVSTGDIARIEILRGGASGRFGASGGGGRVNIITTAGNRLSFRRGSFGTTEASAAAGSDALRAAAGYTQTSGYADGLDGRRVFARAGGRLSGKASIMDVQAGYVGARFGAAQFYGPYPADEDVSRFLGSISASTRLGSVLAGRLRVTGEASRDDFRLFREEPDRYRNVHDTRRVSAELELRGTSRSIDYTLGMSTTGDEIESNGIRNGLASPALGRHKRTFHSLNASLEKESDAWSWRFGLDAGFGDYRGWGGAVVLGRSLFKTVRLTGAFARTFRVPTYTELYYSDPVHLADPSLAAERMDSASVSVDGAFGLLTLGGRAFFNRTDGLIDWVRPDGEAVWQSSNIAAGSFAGIDLRGEWTADHFSTRLLVTRQMRRISAGAGAEMKYHFTFPELSLSLIVSGDIGPWSGSAALKAEREEGSKRIRPYFSARIRRTWGRLELFADFQNLLNQRVERIPGLPEAPRSAGLGLAWEF